MGFFSIFTYKKMQNFKFNQNYVHQSHAIQSPKKLIIYPHSYYNDANYNLSPVKMYNELTNQNKKNSEEYMDYLWSHHLHKYFLELSECQECKNKNKEPTIHTDFSKITIFI